MLKIGDRVYVKPYIPEEVRATSYDFLGDPTLSSLSKHGKLKVVDKVDTRYVRVYVPGDTWPCGLMTLRHEEVVPCAKIIVEEADWE